MCICNSYHPLLWIVAKNMAELEEKPRPCYCTFVEVHARECTWLITNLYPSMAAGQNLTFSWQNSELGRSQKLATEASLATLDVSQSYWFGCISVRDLFFLKFPRKHNPKKLDTDDSYKWEDSLPYLLRIIGDSRSGCSAMYASIIISSCINILKTSIDRTLAVDMCSGWITWALLGKNSLVAVPTMPNIYSETCTVLLLCEYSCFPPPFTNLFANFPPSSHSVMTLSVLLSIYWTIFTLTFSLLGCRRPSRSKHPVLIPFLLQILLI